jgi:hypothetical protein
MGRHRADQHALADMPHAEARRHMPSEAGYTDAAHEVWIGDEQ